MSFSLNIHPDRTAGKRDPVSLLMRAQKFDSCALIEVVAERPAPAIDCAVSFFGEVEDYDRFERAAAAFNAIMSEPALAEAAE